jgi:hypothetical protein
MTLKQVEFRMDNEQAVMLRNRMLLLAKGALELSDKGFPPKRMDKYPVAIVDIEGDKLVEITVEDTAKHKFTFKYFQFADGEIIDQLWKETYENRMTISQQMECLP